MRNTAKNPLSTKEKRKLYETMESLASVVEEHLMLLDTARNHYKMMSVLQQAGQAESYLDICKPPSILPEMTMRGALLSTHMARNFESKFQRTLDILDYYQRNKEEIFNA